MRLLAPILALVVATAPLSSQEPTNASLEQQLQALELTLGQLQQDLDALDATATPVAGTAIEAAPQDDPIRAARKACGEAWAPVVAAGGGPGCQDVVATAAVQEECPHDVACCDDLAVQLDGLDSCLAELQTALDGMESATPVGGEGCSEARAACEKAKAVAGGGEGCSEAKAACEKAKAVAGGDEGCSEARAACEKAKAVAGGGEGCSEARAACEKAKAVAGGGEGCSEARAACEKAKAVAGGGEGCSEARATCEKAKAVAGGGEGCSEARAACEKAKAVAGGEGCSEARATCEKALAATLGGEECTQGRAGCELQTALVTGEDGEATVEVFLVPAGGAQPQECDAEVETLSALGYLGGSDDEGGDECDDCECCRKKQARDHLLLVSPGGHRPAGRMNLEIEALADCRDSHADDEDGPRIWVARPGQAPMQLQGRVLRSRQDEDEECCEAEEKAGKLRPGVAIMRIERDGEAREAPHVFLQHLGRMEDTAIQEAIREGLNEAMQEHGVLRRLHEDGDHEAPEVRREIRIRRAPHAGQENVRFGSGAPPERHERAAAPHGHGDDEVLARLERLEDRMDRMERLLERLVERDR